MFRDTITGNIWCSKDGEDWVLYAHPIYIPAIEEGKLWKVVWNFVRTEVLSDLFPLGGIKIAENVFLQVTEGPTKISHTQVEARVKILKVPGPEPAALVFYTVHDSDHNNRLVHDPTIVVTSDPIYIPPTP